MGIRIEQVDIKSLNKVFPMKDEIRGFITTVEELDVTLAEMKVDIDKKANLDMLSEVATSGSYDDLLNKPTSLPADGGNADTIGGKEINDTVISLDNLWTSERIVEYVNQMTASNETIEEIQDSLTTKADADTVAEMQVILGNKADADTVTELEGRINTKADITSVESLQADLQTKLDEEVYTEKIESIERALNDKVSNAEKDQLSQKIISIENSLENKLERNDLDEINTSLADKVNNSELLKVNQKIDEKATQVELDLVKAELSNFAIKSDVDSLQLMLPNLVTRPEVAEIKASVDNKLSLEDAIELDQKIDTKAPKDIFEALKDEVFKARRGKYSLLDKIIEIDTRLDKLTTAQNNGVTDLAVGSIVWYTGTTAPNTYKVCDGSELSRADYPQLFSIIQTQYGAGDGSTTFNIPNLTTNNLIVRSLGGQLRVSQIQNGNITDVRGSYEGAYSTDKLYLVGGKSFSEEVADMSFEPNTITLLPCIKIKEDKTPDMDTPVGLFTWFANDTLPEDYLECDGREISRTTYSDLFGIIGTTYGAGDGSTTFNIPNLVEGNRYIKPSKTTLGIKSNSNVFLTDVRKAYEGDFNNDKFLPLGGNSFTREVQAGELIPPSIALKPAIKVKKKSTNNDRMEIGTFNWYSSTSTPTGYLICDGSAVSRIDYHQLFAKIGTTYGEGDGITTFNLPNLLSGNKFVRACGGSVALGSSDDLKLADIRDAYEGDKNQSNLYPLGAQFFTNNVLLSGIEPSNMAMLPCIKALNNIKTVTLDDLVGRAMESYSLMTASKSISVEPINLTKEIKLTKGKANLTINKSELGLNEIQSCFVNVSNTDRGVEHICDINSNASIAKDKIVIYFKALDTTMNTAKVTFNIQVNGI